MKLKRILTLTVPLLLCAGAAWASNSGVAQLDLPLNTMGHVAQACGYIVGGIGAIGIIHHIRSGSWLGCAEHLGLATFGGTVVYQFPNLAPEFRGHGRCPGSFHHHSSGSAPRSSRGCTAGGLSKRQR